MTSLGLYLLQFYSHRLPPRESLEKPLRFLLSGFTVPIPLSSHLCSQMLSLWNNKLSCGTSLHVPWKTNTFKWLLNAYKIFYVWFSVFTQKGSYPCVLIQRRTGWKGPCVTSGMDHWRTSSIPKWLGKKGAEGGLKEVFSLETLDFRRGNLS